jgi:RNA polymerase sigma-70 factor (ECF subfamily)
MAGRKTETAGELLNEVYDDLRRLARSRLAFERPDHTLQATALVHEAWLRMARQRQAHWQGRTHFLAFAAQCMRRLLIDHARNRARDKRGGDWTRVTLGGLEPSANAPLEMADLLALDDALERLAALDQRQATVVELRFFGGLTVEEVAELLAISKRTVEDEWTHARAWLKRHLTDRPRT